MLLAKAGTTLVWKKRTTLVLALRAVHKLARGRAAAVGGARLAALRALGTPAGIAQY